MIKLVIFDLDDTLYPEYTFVYEGFREVCRYLSDKYLLDNSLLFNETVEIFKSHGRGRIFNILCNKFNLKENIEELVEIYRNVNPEIKLYEEAEAVLEELKRRKYKLGIITDGKASVQWSKIKALGLEAMVDRIIVTDDYGQENWKPNVYCFELMLKHFGIVAEESVYIGDNPNKDFLPCKKLGIRSVRLTGTDSIYKEINPDNLYEADFKLKSIKDFLVLDVIESEFK